jgi:predicted DNA-binding transcriptional regulator YafY
MSTKRGIKRDSRLANQRRLALIRRLLRGHAPADVLIADLRQELGDDIYPGDAHAALRHDLHALRETYGCTFYYRALDGYFLTSLGNLTILDLEPSEREALALLFAAIDEGALPATSALQHLRHRIMALLPEPQRVEIPQITPRLRIDLPTPSSKTIDSILNRIQPSLAKNEISFAYQSPYSATDELEQHRVAPYEFIQRDGYTYLEAYCLESSIPKLVGRYIFYRIDRILPRSLRRLPQQLAPIRYARRAYRLRYELTPAVASRRDITLWFEGSSCNYTEDGAAIVEASITDLWHARTILLRYREHCRVVEPLELVAMMRESVTNMFAVYATGEL